MSDGRAGTRQFGQLIRATVFRQIAACLGGQFGQFTTAARIRWVAFAVGRTIRTICSLSARPNPSAMRGHHVDPSLGLPDRYRDACLTISRSSLRARDVRFDRREHFIPASHSAFDLSVDVHDFAVQQRSPPVQNQAQDYGSTLFVPHLLIRQPGHIRTVAGGRSSGITSG